MGRSMGRSCRGAPLAYAGGGRPGPERVRRQAAPEAAPGSELRHRQDGALTMLPHWYCHGVLLQVSRGLVLTCG